jgi:hypothetical protein
MGVGDVGILQVGHLRKLLENQILNLKQKVFF